MGWRVGNLWTVWVESEQVENTSVSEMNELDFLFSVLIWRSLYSGEFS